jgi:hypothetical protein
LSALYSSLWTQPARPWQPLIADFNANLTLNPMPCDWQTRTSINAATWTPDGRRLLTGTQVVGAACREAMRRATETY